MFVPITYLFVAPPDTELVPRTELIAAESRIVALEGECSSLRAENAELSKLVELQKAEITRFRQALASSARNQPERVMPNQIQLAFGRVLAGVEASDQREALLAANDSGDPDKKGKKGEQGRKRGGRRKLSLENLPVIELPSERPIDVGDGTGWTKIGEQMVERLGFRPGCFFVIRVPREKWIRNDTRSLARSPITAIADVPEWTRPGAMADASVVSGIIVSKYDFLLPLARQERMSRDFGFTLPRSTQCNWLKEAAKNLRWIVRAMHREMVASSSLIATDSTSAPVRGRAKKSTTRLSVFAYLGDVGHIVFDARPSATSAAVEEFLQGYRGGLLGDASSIYDSLVRTGVVKKYECWAHLRRYFWKAASSHPTLAHEALSLISHLFKVERRLKGMSREQRRRARSRWGRPLVDAFDAWYERNVTTFEFEERTPIAAAFTYYRNQKEGLRRFLETGDVPIHNNHLEQLLRNLVLGLNNWMHFENETGLEWYTVFRSLIASARLHGLNPFEYLDGALRLVPHWTTTRAIELAPKYWATTVANLDAHWTAIVCPPWKASVGERMVPAVAAA